ncbi:MAG: hypothetical protein ACMG6S_06960 [Byssovorax sp.]
MASKAPSAVGVSGHPAGEAGNVDMHPGTPPVDALALDVALLETLLLETLLLETLLLDVPPPDPPEPEGSLSDEQACAISRVRAQVITAMDLMFMVFFTSSSQSLMWSVKRPAGVAASPGLPQDRRGRPRFHPRQAARITRSE